MAVVGPEGWRRLVEEAERFQTRKTGRSTAGAATVEEHVEAGEQREDARYRARVARGR